MSELANYSIETDSLILLAFKDGKSLRVPVGQLPHYLAPRDLQRVRRAIQLRRDFFRQHMPRTLIIVLALGALAFAATGSVAIAYLVDRWSAPDPTPSKTEIVRNVGEATANPPPAPAVAGGAAAAPSPRAVASHVRPAPTPKPARSAGVTRPAVAVTPYAEPGAVVTAPTPTPEPSPEPTPLPSPEPPSGQVLGDSTGPDATTPPPETQQ